MGFRAFISVDLSPLPALDPFLADLARIKGVKAVGADSLHLTLKFLGDADEALVPRIEGVMRSSVRDVPAFPIEVAGSGTFPAKGSARVVWVGLLGAEPLAVVAERLEEGLEPLGFMPESRPFQPHLTLARVKDPDAGRAARQLSESHAQERFGTKLVRELCLKKSVLRPQGPEYSTVLAVPFA